MIIKTAFKRFCVTVAATSGLLLVNPAHAVNFEWGDFEGSADFSFSAAASWRTQERDNSIVAKRNIEGQGGFGGLCADDQTGGGNPLDALGGCVLDKDEHQTFADPATPGYYSQNGDNGNLNYDKGEIVASAFKLTTDLSGSYGDFGFSARFIGFYDWENDGREEFHPDSGTAHAHQSATSQMNRDMEEAMVFNAAMEEANVYYNFDVGERSMSLGLGRKVLSWGESLTFPINSVNSNTIPSLIRLNTPGGDLKELFVPVNQIVFSSDVTENISMEAFYQLEWEPITNHLPSANSFFSTSDTAGIGGTYAMLSFGKEPEDPDNLQDNNFVDNDGDGKNDLAGRGCINEAGPIHAELGVRYEAHRGEASAGRTICRVDTEADWKDQWGVKFKAYSEALNDTEFGFYYMNYHSRLPLASFIAADEADGAAKDATTLAGLQADNSTIVQTAVDTVAALPNALALVDTSALVLEYPEDIEMFGFSFNTTVGDISISGEYAYRPNQPLQITTPDLTLYALGTAFNGFRGVGGPSFVERYRASDADKCGSDYQDDPNLYQACSRVSPDQIVQGYERLPVGHASTTILWSSSQNPWGADQWLLIGDTSFTKVFGMPDKSVLQFSAPGDDLHASIGRFDYHNDPSQYPIQGTAAIDDVATQLGGILAGAGITLPVTDPNDIVGLIMQNPKQEDLSTFADSFSWGYRILSILKYNNAVFGYNWEQLFGFFHDVNGNSPGPGGDFIEGRKKFLWGTKLVKGPWTLEGKYTWFTGAGDRNQERDRDHFQAAVKYVF